MKRTFVVLMILVVSLFAAVGVFAQDDATPEETPEATDTYAPRPGGPRGFGGGMIFDLVSETLGVDAETLQTALHEDGATWSSVIESLGGDVDEIHALIVEQITADLEARLAEVDGNVTDMLNNTLPVRGMNPDGGFGPGNGGMGPRDGGRGGRGPRGGNGAPDDAPPAQDDTSASS